MNDLPLSTNGEILALRRAGYTVTNIGMRVGLTAYVVRHRLERMKRQGIDITKGTVPDDNNPGVWVPLEAMELELIAHQAAKRGLSAGPFLSLVLSTIARDRLWDAVLDEDKP